MNDEKNDKSKEGTAPGRTEGSASSCPIIQNSEGGAKKAGRKTGDFTQRVSGTTGARRAESTCKFLLGGIVTQLIADAEDRLGEVEECIEWYQREKGKVERRITELKQLQQLAFEEVDTEHE